jgi:hypothetical protein
MPSTGAVFYNFELQTKRILIFLYTTHVKYSSIQIKYLDLFICNDYILLHFKMYKSALKRSF